MKTIITKIIPSPVGDLFAGADDKEIFILEFTNTNKEPIEEILKNKKKKYDKAFNASLISGENETLNKLQLQLNEYFDKKRKYFDLPLHINGTDFQKSVWDALLKIPYGRTISYQKQAENIGKIKAVRAVANANGANKIVIVIPCHRVIGKNGTLTGFGGGLWRKKLLLELEK